MTRLPDGLGYLHDATVVALEHRVDDDGTRVIELVAWCNPDAGHPDRDGRRVRLRLDDVLVATWRVHGEVHGQETIDRVNGVLSDEMFAQRARLLNDGVAISISFHSGSRLEAVCGAVTTSIDPIAPHAMHPSTRQGVDAELRHAVGLAPGWSYEVFDDRFVIKGPMSPSFTDEVWRISRYVSYTDSVCLERTSTRPLEYRMTSRGSRELHLVVVFQAVDG